MFSFNKTNRLNEKEKGNEYEMENTEKLKRRRKHNNTRRKVMKDNVYWELKVKIKKMKLDFVGHNNEV